MSHFMDQGGIRNQYDSTSTLKGSIERTVYKQPSWSVTNRDTSKIAVIGTDKSGNGLPTSMNTFEKRELVHQEMEYSFLREQDELLQCAASLRAGTLATE